MAYIIDLPTHSDTRGHLTVVEKILPFEIKRFYYIYDVVGQRGGHRQHKTSQALISLGGTCEIYVHNGEYETVYILDTPSKCLILDPQDWHTMDKFTKSTTLLVFASEYYDVNDYIDEKY